MRPIYLLLATLLLFSCKKKIDDTPKNTPRTTTEVSFFNACVNCSNVGVKLNDDMLVTEPVGYLQRTDYMDVPLGKTVRISFVDLTTGNTLKHIDTMFFLGYNYLLAIGGAAPDSLAIIRRAHVNPTLDFAQVRFYNLLLKDNAFIEFSVKGTQVVYPTTTYAFGSYTDYKNCGAGYGNITADDSLDNFHTNLSLTLKTGSIYTAILSGRYGDTGITKPTFTVVEDKPWD